MPTNTITRCKGTGRDYCTINRTKLRQTGHGYQKICPVCGKIYEIEVPPKKLTPEERQKIINRVHNIPPTNPGI